MNRAANPQRSLFTTLAAPRVIVSVLAFILGLPTISRSQDDNMLPPGIYRLELIMASISRIPFLGTSKSASRSLSLVEIRHEEGSLRQTHKVCDVRVLEQSVLAKMVFPERFVAALKNQSYPIRVEKDQQGWLYRADLGLESIGYKNGTDGGGLPQRIDDPSVYDWDGDGHPGATLRISVPLLPDGEIYIVQRGHTVLHGRITQPGHVEGAIEYKAFEQRVLGAWPGFLNRSPEITPDPKRSRFTMRVLPAGTSCQMLREQAANDPVQTSAD